MNIFSTKNVVVIGGAFLILILFASTSQPVKQAVLGASELLPFIPSPTTDADTIEGKTIQEWLESAHPINAATLNGNPGLFYLDADNITGEISTGKFSAYDDLVAEGIIPDGSKLITETDAESIQNEDPFAVEASDTLELSKVGNQLSGTVIQSGIKSSLINNDAGFIVNLKSFSTSDLKEGANLYFSLNRFNAEFDKKNSDDLTQGSVNLFSQWINKANGVVFANRVGIGTTADPIATLQVDGDFIVSEGITASIFTTNGGLLYTNSSGALTQLAAGAAGQCLKATGGVPTWGACAAGDSITGTGATGELAFFNSNSTLTGSSGLSWDPDSSTLTVTGNITMAGNIIPSADITYNLGSPTMQWKDVYIGPGSLYINGQKVLQESGESIIVSADPDQNLVMQTTNTGDIEFAPLGTGAIQLKGNVLLTGGKTFRTSDNSAILFSDGIRAGNLQLSGNLFTTANTNGDLEIAPNGNGNTYFSSGNVGIGTTDTGSYRMLVQGDTEENIFGVTDGVASAGIYIDNGATTYAQVQFGSTSNHDLGFFTNNGLPGITLTTTGNVGIGTANPDSGYKLDVIGALAINDEMAISQDGTTQNHISFLHSDSFESASDVWRLRVGGSDTPDGLAFGFFDNTPNLWLDNDGSVGVGTVTPSAQLDVDGTIRASGIATLSNYTVNGGLLLTNNTGVISQTATGSAGQCLQSAGGGSPVWGACNAANTITGTGAAGQVSFFNGANTTTGSSSFIWDNTTSRLGIGVGATTGATLDVSSNSTTSNAAAIKANALTTGTGLAISSTSTSLTTGGLLGLSWMPGSATSMTGDLFSINVGPNGTVGNLLNLMNDGLSVFSVSQSQIVANVPVAFRAAGNMSVAHNLIFTNSTSANIDSASPLRITAGEVFNSSDLTLATYNYGAVVLDTATVATANDTNVGIGIYMPTAGLHIRAGVADAGGAPVKFTSGTLLTTPEAGAFEFNGTHLSITDNNGNRHTLASTGQTQTFFNKSIAAGAEGGLSWIGGAAPGLSTAGNAKTYFDSTSNTYKISENGGAYADVLAANRPIQTPLSTKSGAYTITETDSIILADTSGGTFAVTLPTAVGITGKQYTIKQMTASGYATVETNGSETIDGAANFSFSAQYETITVASNGSNWVIISKN